MAIKHGKERWELKKWTRKVTFTAGFGHFLTPPPPQSGPWAHKLGAKATTQCPKVFVHHPGWFQCEWPPPPTSYYFDT